jgi:hypothetical protein
MCPRIDVMWFVDGSAAISNEEANPAFVSEALRRLGCASVKEARRKELIREKGMRERRESRGKERKVHDRS